MTPILADLLLALQCFHVAFLFLHDWIPLGRLSDVAMLRTMHTRKQLLAATFIVGTPFAFGLACSLHYHAIGYPVWLRTWLRISYGFLFLGELREWWIPYLWRPNAALAARYQSLFGRTHSFLPLRNGLVPNTLHVILHTATFTTLLLLIWL